MKWTPYVLAWAGAALFFTLASASGANRSPIDTLPYGVLAMGSAGVMGVGVWWLTGGVAWDWRSVRFYWAHLSSLAAFSCVYATNWVLPDFLAGRVTAGLTSVRTSPLLIWNLMLGSWLYLVVAALSYAIRGQRRIRAQEAAAADARLSAQQAQLAALRAQVNPHFLFNALHSVGALVVSDPALADRALERLGDLLRYVLGAEDAVPFGQEWRFTKDYLAFETLRLGERLRVDENVASAALPVLVPPLIFQPLVENAVRHGLADRPEGGRIGLRARVEGTRLLLSVTDDGHGDGGKAADGLGLGSIRRRLEGLYGSRATLTIHRAPNEFSVTLDLPLPPTDDEAATS